ncbi:MAG: T9SS type A sorting domain-containing protein [Salinivirgaceae bacterium]|nr:T9SS type A sorting domain-containing protein [Salinivirgaceae bacterium]
MRLPMIPLSRFYQRLGAFGLLILLSVQPALAQNIQGSKADGEVNLALSATVSTSFCSSWETLGAVNDGDEPTSSTEDDGKTYGNWNGEGSYNTWNWVQYDWEQINSLVSTSAYWWSDGGGISKPYAAYVDYWDGSDWVLLDSIGTLLNTYNTITIDNVKTNKIRIYMISLTSTGIQQWKVMGIKGQPCDPTPVIAKYKMNDGDWKDAKYISVNKGTNLALGAFPSDSGTYSWDGPTGYISGGAEILLSNMQLGQGGTYNVTLSNNCWATSDTSITVTVVDSMNLGSAYHWPLYSPVLSYNFRQEYPDLQMPTKDLPDCEGVVGAQSKGWWTFLWGADKNSLVTSNAITPLLDRMNEDFAYFRDTLGWPPDKRAKNGYRSAIYLFGSGLCTDNASNTEKGGWQSATSYNGESWPMVLLSYYPVYSFDPSNNSADADYQQGACVHEGIHSVLADLPGAKEAAWFQEGGNTWLQQEMESRRSGDYSSMGFLNGCNFIAPFMPIECYSGWLQDDSFGGPSAEGVNKTNASGAQICTWRNYLGGTQYGNAFPTFLSMTLGHESVAWIWRNCPGRVLEGMADTLGEAQTRRLIMEYRAKQALLDMGKWTGALRSLMDSYMGTTIKEEWSPYWIKPKEWSATPYVTTTKNVANILTPEYRTTPGWSGSNQIPLFVSGNQVTVNFQPIGENMCCMLCYRDTTGKPIYSQPVYGGDCTLKLETPPGNGVVIAVIANTDYIYKGEETRKAHYDYRLQLGEGVIGVANTKTKWYNWKNMDNYIGIDTEKAASTSGSVIYPNPLNTNADLNIAFENTPGQVTQVQICNLMGQVIYNASTTDKKLTISNNGLLSKGVYLIVVKNGTYRKSHKLIVQ